MDFHEGKVAKAFAIGAVGGRYSLLARPIANASCRLIVTSNSEYSLFERIRYWSRTELISTLRNKRRLRLKSLSALAPPDCPPKGKGWNFL